MDVVELPETTGMKRFLVIYARDFEDSGFNLAPHLVRKDISSPRTLIAA